MRTTLPRQQDAWRLRVAARAGWTRRPLALLGLAGAHLAQQAREIDELALHGGQELGVITHEECFLGGFGGPIHGIDVGSVPLDAGVHLSRRRGLEIVVEPSDRHAEDLRQLENARGADAGFADLVFLNLLRRDVDDFGKLLQTYLVDLAQQPQPLAHVLVDRSRLARRHAALLAHVTGRLACCCCPQLEFRHDAYLARTRSRPVNVARMASCAQPLVEGLMPARARLCNLSSRAWP